MSSEKEFLDSYSDKNWKKSGLIMAVFLFVINGFVIPFFMDDKFYFEVKAMLTLIVISIVGGLLFGFTMNRYFKFRQNK